MHKGDRIWWDLHDWTVTNSVPAVVGSFPEPFVHGTGGKRYPTTLECGAGMTAICSRVVLGAALGRRPARRARRSGPAPETTRSSLVVGTWPRGQGADRGQPARDRPAAQRRLRALRERGHARCNCSTPAGHVARTLGAGAGLIAATRDTVSAPTWLITGTDTAGVTAAAAALTQDRLKDHFALAVAPGGTDIPIPVGSAMSYRRRATPLHAAGAAAGCAYCISLGLAALLLDNPIALARRRARHLRGRRRRGRGARRCAGRSRSRCRWRS